MTSHQGRVAFELGPIYRLLQTLMVVYATSILCNFAFKSRVFARKMLNIETILNGWMGIRQSDMSHGYFMFWIPVAVVSLISLTLLRSRRNRESKLRFLLLPGTGIVILSLAPLVSLFRFLPELYWPHYEAWLEVGVLLFCAALLAFKKLRRGMEYPVVTIPVLGAIYLLWYLFPGIPGIGWTTPGYDGPAGPILGFLTTATWTICYAKQQVDSGLTLKTGIE